MKRNMFLIFGLLALTVTAVYAQPKAKKVLDKNVPVDESAILYFPGDSVVYQCDDTKFGVVGTVSTMNLKGSGGDYSSKIAKPILQVPAGQRTITANAQSNSYYDGRKVTADLLPGHYYQLVLKLDTSEGTGKGIGNVMLTSMLGGVDWCFLDITDEVKAGKKSFKEKWEALAKQGELGKDQVMELYGNLNSLRKD